ncbi:MAG: 1-acyl-sn-glycerol-3-phosphate acyltransferase [Actinomycetia bacterium]|nr:1-acyl-sn-glycerol-3-phosphate acyltransferase [Actinomycetes bacterium]
MRDLTYPTVIQTARVAFRLLGLKFQMSGTEHVPRAGGAILAMNHVSYVDFIFGGFAAQPSRRLVRFMAKREVFDDRIAGPVMRSMHHISVDRADGIASYREGVEYARRGEVVGVFPEATISRSMELKEFKSGAVRMAIEAGVPVIPVVLGGTPLVMTKDHPRDFSRGRTIGLHIGEPIRPDGSDPAAETADVRAAMTGLLDHAIRTYPVRPEGKWWAPLSYGGTAPSPVEAARLDEEERRRRAERKR